MAKCKYSLRFEVVVIFPELQRVCPFQRAGLKLRTAQFPTLIVLFHRSECNILDIGKKTTCTTKYYILMQESNILDLKISCEKML